MSIPLRVRGTVYNYPEPGEDPGGWGLEATSWAQAVTDTLTLIILPNDILPTSFPINNNVTLETIVSRLYFNPALVRAANISYYIARSTDDMSVIETGDILITYDDSRPMGSKWQVSQRTTDPASGVILTIDDTGQFSYTSNQLLGLNYNGIIRFSARTLDV